MDREHGRTDAAPASRLRRSVRLGVDWLWDDRIATTTAEFVRPSEVAEFRFAVRAPTSRGVYRLDLRPVIDGTTWMEDQGVFRIIEVR
jgi:hypothetical protein